MTGTFVLQLLLFAGLSPESSSGEDVDALMAKVFEKRLVEWDNLHGYVFNESEKLELTGPAEPPIASFRREYIWFVRDAVLVRSPQRSNGIRVPGHEQKAYEERWLKEKKADSLERENFFKLKYQPGTYLLAGTRTFEGRPALVIEHYPRTEKKQSNEPEDRYEEAFYKTSRIVFLVNPEEYQIVQMTFENVSLDFLPYRWLVRVDELHASMTMHKAFGEVWLPREIRATGTVSFAVGPFSVTYLKTFSQYQRTDVKFRLRFEDDVPESPKP